MSVYKDRGSKFIGLAFPVDREETIKELLLLARNDHPAARHYCYAWRIGVEGESWRSNDDGEPSGSAGKPILGQLLSSQVTHALVIVVRYFGGTLLGVGGLINAYRQAAAHAIASAGIKERFVMEQFIAEFDEADVGEVMRLLKQLEAEIQKTDYQQRHALTFSVKSRLASELQQKFKGLHRVTLTPVGL